MDRFSDVGRARILSVQIKGSLRPFIRKTCERTPHFYYKINGFMALRSYARDVYTEDNLNRRHKENRPQPYTEFPFSACFFIIHFTNPVKRFTFVCTKPIDQTKEKSHV